MFKSLAAQALALCLAATATASVLASMDLLATQQHAGMALAKGAVAKPMLLASAASHH